ncbi:MAG: hypothetical protein NT105_08765 [Verrucomicrobia bacterium]|nr:hypothetical protein [Verrucomicrobiota bacterium]
MKRALLAFGICLAALASAAAGDGTIINAHSEARFGKPIAFRKLPGTAGTMSLEISGRKLYALEDRGLSVFDISDPRNPKRLGHVGGMGNVRQLRVSGKTAFLSSRQCGLWAVDVSDDKNPRILSNFDGVEMATGLDVAGAVAFLGHRVFGIQCVDVSDPVKMKHLSSLRTDESQSVYYRNGLLLSGDWAGGQITAIDVANLLAPKAISKISLDGYGDGMCMRGNILFASTGQHKKSGPPELRHGAGHGLDIFDVSDPRQPVKLSRISFPNIYFGPCDYWTPRISGDYCFAADTVNGVFLVDVSDLKKPKILGHVILPKRDPENPKIAVPFKQIVDPKIPQGDPVSSIAVGDGVLYISGNYTGIYLADLPQIAKTESRDFGALPKLPGQPFDANEKGFYTSGAELSNPTRAVAIKGDIAYTANVWDGVKIYRLSENGITQIGRAAIKYAADIKRSGDRLYVAEGQNGIGVYKLVSDTKLEEIGRLAVLDKTLNFVQFLWAFDGCAVVPASCGTSRIHFVDFSNPSQPKIIGNELGEGLLYNNYAGQNLVKGRYFGLSRTFGGLQIFDLKDGSEKLVWHDKFPLCSQTGTIAAFGDEFLVMRCCGYAFFDPEKPVPTREMKRLAFPGQGKLCADIPDDSAISRSTFPKSEWEGQVNVDQVTGKVAVANRMFKNCHIYDFSDKANPKLLKKIELNANPNVPAFWNGRVVLPCGYSGLLLEKQGPLSSANTTPNPTP